MSGLKTSVSKTKAIWFGKDAKTQDKLCVDLNLGWDTKFKLLGVDFDNELENMDCNFTSKLAEMKKILDCWIYRSLTVYGKITVIKTLALSKVSHLALVLPNLNKKQIKDIEKMLFNFLWGGKPDKVSRDHAKLSEKRGGLGFVDIAEFWLSLKFSWFRRLTSTKAFWPLILVNSIRMNLVDINVCELMQLGPAKLLSISKNIQNPFWKQVLATVTPIMQGAISSYPEKLITAPFWDNRYILRNNLPITKAKLPVWSTAITNVCDFFESGSGRLKSKEDWYNNFGLVVSDADILEIKYILRQSFNRLGVRENTFLAPILPYRPLLIEIANTTTRGCNYYNKILKAVSDPKKNMNSREAKWNAELNCNLSVEFWSKVYHLTAGIKYENKLKWLQFQISRNSLYTNQRVNKFNPSVPSLCSFCKNYPEQISHLFYFCEDVLKLWRDIKAWLSSLNVDFLIETKTIIFGILNESSDSVRNELILYGKYYVWISKHAENCNLNLQLFQKFLFHKLECKKDALSYCGLGKKFDQWTNIFEFLLRLPICLNNCEAPMPERTAETENQDQTVTVM